MTDPRITNLAQMLYNLKELSAGRYAIENFGDGAEAALNQAGQLLKDGPYSNNHKAVDQLIERATTVI